MTNYFKASILIYSANFLGFIFQPIQTHSNWLFFNRFDFVNQRLMVTRNTPTLPPVEGIEQYTITLFWD